MMMGKKEIKKNILKQRQSLNNNFLINRSLIINKKILTKFNLINKKIGVYFPINNEVFLDDFFNLKNNTIYIPIIKRNKIYFSELLKKRNRINMNFFKKSFIKNNNKLINQKINKNILIPEILIIPIVGFSEKCFRVGYGGGYYDKYLKNKAILKIGVAFEFQKQMFHEEHHDIQLDYIFTERKIYKKSLCKI